MMSEAVAFMSGLYIENNRARVSITIGPTNLCMSTDLAKSFVRRILLSIDDAEEYNKQQEVNDE
jgi:hypothetical protein